MLDSFEILTTSGVVLWSRVNSPINASIVNSLVSDVFIEERATPSLSHEYTGHSTYKKERYTLKYTTLKDLGLIFVVRI